MPTTSPAPHGLTENQVESAIIGFLQRHGWIVDRNMVGLLYTADGRPCPVGRRGQCDWRAVRPTSTPGVVQYLELETKRPGAKPTCAQREYMAIRQHQGVAVTWADSLDGFVGWYGGVFGGAA